LKKEFAKSSAIAKSPARPVRLVNHFPDGKLDFPKRFLLGRNARRLRCKIHPNSENAGEYQAKE
jgi:hypothetical protein